MWRCGLANQRVDRDTARPEQHEHDQKEQIGDRSTVHGMLHQIRVLFSTLARNERCLYATMV